MGGLSPRVRGNQTDSDLQTRQDRPIPAGAGEPAENAWGRQVLKAYPRGCGGTHRQIWKRYKVLGLSPRVRGNPHPDKSVSVTHGPIPAGAGEPKIALGSRRMRRAYPRGCGGTGSTVIRGVTAFGLSPRVRGNPLSCCPRTDTKRPIPAGAGEPSIFMSISYDR